ncbi:hypothetical protein ISN44_As11g016330 [Arabidopsis suecica]|uniref:Uncharacterized protein n=2 Tax=Arabidopsis suecica TaxID=45249 RepID=A0A8T1Z914_ARASU|nr:hypothetical protein ISN44_As11g016330 [Arabidopsis suecica]KAG7555500.1 hypothetical protein ISN44_As11g016330 [Arabidopsis suecica]KAG7555502.1 hypothetical protein ISN44_As11g016330 [Arabidopsis suecica]
MCHEPTNISSSESDFTFPDEDHLPLTSRRSLLLSSERVSQCIAASVPASNVDSILKREEEEEDCFNELGVVSNCDATESVNTEILESTSFGCSQGLNDSGNLRPQNNILVCCSNGEENFKRVEETERSDALEHLTLKERRKMLLERVAVRLPESNLEDNSKDCDETDLYKIKAEISCENGIASSSGVQFSGFLEKIDSVLCRNFSIGSESGSQLSGLQESDIPISHERSFGLSPEASLPEVSSRDDEHSPLGSNANRRKSVKRVKRNHLRLNETEIQSTQVKVDPLGDCVMENNDEKNPVTSEQIPVKIEVETHGDALDENELDSVKLSFRLNRCTSTPNPSRCMKNEAETASELDEDVIDHMKLIDRLKLRSFHGSGHHEDLNSPSSGFSFCTSDEYVKPSRVFRPWKRKKTATDSIETALEEDAPGLLQVLIQQGVSVDELRLYGNEDGDVSSDDSLLDESFSELEDVISQLFFKRETGTKLLNSSFSKVSRTSYCLTCLFSLIEQARYLQFRKWPVEWGWCRDLQSFIFVFERHNRIVMERPEYGYATYFFELSNTASIRWQIKRLVLAMKLASCGRYQLIENKPLLVGEDMTEGEAEVLMKYGWVANTGLGTMVNYRDRVYHDRKTQKQTSVWRCKISELLVDGYNSGTIVSTFIAPHDDDDVDDAGLYMGDVKLESY